MNLTDKNRLSETVLIPLLSEVYGYTKLKNLNDTEQENYAGIDLADRQAKVAFQITSDPGNEKIKETLKKFIDRELYKEYEHLIFYIITEKQQSYSGKGQQEIIQGKFVFDKDTDILDYQDILKKVKGFQIDQAERVERILEKNFGDRHRNFFTQINRPKTEEVLLNLLEIKFPDKLYIADLAIDRDEVIVAAQIAGKGLTQRATTREVIQEALSQKGLKFSSDWTTYQRKIITFHDLHNDDLPLTKVIDKGTVDELAPEEIYKIDANYERVFKTLLKFCLQQKLYRQQVLWQNKDEIFFFDGIGDKPERKERWHGKKWDERTVFEIIKNKKTEKFICYKHLAFKVQFKQFGAVWYILIKPEWFFSFDRYKRSYYHAEKTEWLKGEEGNEQVFNHLRFITYFLKQDGIGPLFGDQGKYPFLSFGELLNFNNAPSLDDEYWNVKDEKRKAKSDQQANLFDR